MNLDQIALRIADPASCQGTEIQALKDLSEKYPFAQVFSILYLKALSNQNDIGFEEALQKHAYKVTDRMKLYDLIHSAPLTEETTETQEETAIVEEAILPIEAVIAEPETTALETIETEEEIVPAEVESTVESELIEATPEKVEPIEAHIPENIEPAVEEIISEVEPVVSEEIQETIDVEEETILPETEVVAESEPAAEKHFEISEKNPIEDALELEIISQVVATVYNDNLEKSIPEIKVEEKKPEEAETKKSEEKPSLATGKRSFSSWLKAGDHPLDVADTQETPEIPKKIEEVEKQIDNIINTFIEKEPSISRPKKEFYSPTKKAKESINPEGLIYTETLANIFAIQGNFPKAILAYEQLMLTNPEKKIFFALRIEELKEKLNT